MHADRWKNRQTGNEQNWKLNSDIWPWHGGIILIRAAISFDVKSSRRKIKGKNHGLASLIRVFAVHMMKAWVLSYPLSTQQILWLDWADAQADLSLHWAQSHFVGFVMLWLILVISGQQRMTTSMKALRNEVPLRFGQTFISNKIQTLDPWSKVRNTIKLPSYINTSHRLAESGFLCK